MSSPRAPLPEGIHDQFRTIDGCVHSVMRLSKGEYFGHYLPMLQTDNLHELKGWNCRPWTRASSWAQLRRFGYTLLVAHRPSQEFEWHTTSCPIGVLDHLHSDPSGKYPVDESALLGLRQVWARYKYRGLTSRDVMGVEFFALPWAHGTWRLLDQAALTFEGEFKPFVVINDVSRIRFFDCFHDLDAHNNTSLDTKIPLLRNRVWRHLAETWDTPLAIEIQAKHFGLKARPDAGNLFDWAASDIRDMVRDEPARAYAEGS